MANEKAPVKCVPGDDLYERMMNFCVRVYKLVRALPKDSYSRHVGLQLFRCATSSGANYGEARGAESDDDFVHKLSVVFKESKESQFWLTFIGRAEMLKPHLVGPLRQEAEELCRIFATSVRTAKKRSSRRR